MEGGCKHFLDCVVWWTLCIELLKGGLLALRPDTRLVWIIAINDQGLGSRGHAFHMLKSL